MPFLKIIPILISLVYGEMILSTYKNYFHPGLLLLVKGFVEEWESKKDGGKVFQ